jgi:gas vesicle protein
LSVIKASPDQLRDGRKVESEDFMMFPTISVFATSIISIAQPTSSGFDFTTLLPSLLGVLIGGLVSSATSFLLNNRSNKQQLMRDEAEYQRQKEREQIAYNRQIEREQAAYARSLKDAKRERLRSAYKVIHNAADKFRYEAEQLNHTPSYVNISSRLSVRNVSFALTGHLRVWTKW